MITRTQLKRAQKRAAGQLLFGMFRRFKCRNT